MADDIFAPKNEMTDEEKADIFGDSDPGRSLQGVSETGLSATSGNIMQMAEFLSRSTVIPAAYQGKPANCFVALEYAQRIGASPMMVMQNLDIIAGKPSWSSKFLTAVANDCGRFSPIRYRMTGTKGQDDWGCIAWFKELPDGEILEGPEVTIKMAKDEGWYGKSGSKWKTIPELMLHYRAAAFLVRIYAPELTMGLNTKEEHEDMINVTTGGPIPVEEMAAERAWREQEGLK